MSFAMFLAVRFFTGLFIGSLFGSRSRKGGWMTVSFVLLTELVGSEWRAFVGTFTMVHSFITGQLIQVFFSMGELLLAAIAAATPPWRMLLLAACAPNVVFLMSPS
jgi:hypothetical protein